MNTAWQYLGIGSFSTSLLFGIVGRKRNYFSSQQQFNKYHFGVFCQFLCGFGFNLVRKTKNPFHVGSFFIAGTVLNSFMAYYEGYLDVNQKLPPDFDTGTYRMMGLYCIIFGYALYGIRHGGIKIF